MAHQSRPTASSVLLACGLVLASATACGGGGEETTNVLGPPGGAKKPAAAAPTAAAAKPGEEDVDLGPPRPPVALDGKSFVRRRDPFERAATTEQIIVEPPAPRSANRKVQMAQYSFEDLKLIAIVNSGRGITPRALFLASDGKSQTIEQGEYFSSAEVLLAAVNRDYVEIEVVDDDLASSLNLQRGERRAIFLRNE